MVAIDQITVVGGGVMGSGIGQTFLQHGYEVTIREINETEADACRDRIDGGAYGLETAVENGILTEDERADALERLTVTTSLKEAVEDAEFVVTAVPEDLSVKGDTFSRLDELTDDVPLTTNTGGFPITAIANAVEDPSRVVGTHYFNPVPVMSLVEIIATEQTADEVVALAEDLAESIDKTPVVVSDEPTEYGFVANRVFWAMLDEAKAVVEDGVATREQVDTIMEEGFNHPAGPFQYVDPDWNP
jgi:3-hydroxybutyryl-CoA dehydrogenase